MKKTRKKITNGIIFIIVAVYAVVSVYPLIWVILQSFKSESQFLQSIWSLPSSLHFENYQTAFTTGKLGLYFFNTVKNTAATLVVDLVLITLAAIVFPYYQGFAPLGLVLATNYFNNIPDEVIEAARIDGCNTPKVLISIVVPLAKPILTTLAILGGMNAWNEYMWSLTSISNTSRYTLSVGIATLRDQTSILGYTPVFAALSASAIVFVILFLCAQRTFVESITAGAVKG